MKKYLLSTALLLAACSTDNSSVATYPTEPVVSTTQPPKKVKLAAVGDISCKSSSRGGENCQDVAVARIVANYGPSYTLLLGDIQYEDHNLDEFNQNFAQIWLDIETSFMPIAGNHEYAQSGAADYYESWPGVEPYYAFDINKKWRVVALNSNDACRFIGCNVSSEQYKWLEAELQAHPNKCVIGMIHAPRYSSGAHGSAEYTADIFNLMSRYKVAVVLSGHDHHYERIELHGQPKQYVVGTGGKNLRNTGTPVDGSVKIIDDSYGVLLMEIYGNKMTEQFVDINGVVLDSATTICYK